MKHAAVMFTLGVAIALLALFPQSTRAERATDEEMERVCRNWLSYVVHHEGEWAGDIQPTIVRSQDLILDGTVLARCFSIAPRGHVVVPVLKELPPIKAHSDACDLDPNQKGGFPELLRQVLGYHVDRFVRACGSLDATDPPSRPTLFDPANRERWRLLLLGPDDFRDLLRTKSLEPRTAVGPLLTTAWHQEAPYNNLCPQGDTTCVTCYGGAWPPCPNGTFTGCVATATTQIMNYHEWPPSGVGGFIHTWDGDNSCSAWPPIGAEPLVARFHDGYDWANMPDTCDGGCSEAQANAVAELCYEVGVAYEMDYGVCASTAYMESSLVVLPDYFHYDTTIAWEDRSVYLPSGDSLWWEIIRQEINASRPMLYSLAPGGPIDTHALVCDGWSDYVEGYSYGVHLNFGWGPGSWNGWYALDDSLGWPGTNVWIEALVRNIKPAPFTVHTVSAGGGGFTTIQAAIGAAQPRDVVELVDPSYSGPGNRNLVFGGKALTVRSRSGAPDSCVIECGGSPNQGFRFVSGEKRGSVVLGITIRGGDADYGGGIYSYNGSLPCIETSPTLIDCVLRENEASSGGGLYMVCSRSVVIGCTFSGNTARASTAQGGGASVNGYSPRFAYCTFSGDSAVGTGPAPMSYGGGMYFSVDSFSVLTRCTFLDNRAAGGAINQGGGLYWTQPGAKIADCVFGSNGASGTYSSGGALYCGGGAIASCTFSGNTSTGSASCSGASIHGGNLDLENTIIAFGDGCEPVTCTGAAIACCDVFGNGGGDYVGCIAGQNGLNGNFSEDPLFCDAGNRDYTIDCGSPCLDAPGCGRVGALGPGCDATIVAGGTAPVHAGPYLAQNVPNPFNATTVIRFGIPAPGEVRVAVYDVSGRRVAVLVDGHREAGEHVVPWHGRNDRGKVVASGIYFTRLRTGEFATTRKMVLLD
ncbi:MAG: C10 family peptidase [Candidatus Eisenbacteria bacterium]